jgi:hypothetical protein
MGDLLKQFWWASREHCGEDILLSLLDGELSIMQARRVHKHLERCWTCRARRDALEKTILQFVGYRTQLISPHMPPPRHRRERFLASLDELIQSKKKPWWSHFAQTSRRFYPQMMSPVLASALVVGAAAVLLLFIWQRSLPPMSAGVLLAKAQASDSQPAATTHSGVIYQKVEIRTKSNRLERAIYRDISGKRKPRHAAATPANEAMKQKVELAGIDWQEPLSVRDFRDWHDRQLAPVDKVSRSGDQLLTLTTSVPAGPIASEVLTVRADDFHAVGRTVEMRGDERIEIAELNYAVLGWSDVNEALFEPFNPVSPTPTPLHLATLPTPAQLDMAELQARLVLSRLNADSTEQLEFSRTNAVVQIKGIVDTNQRRNTLVARLQHLPHVSTAIFSIEELNAHRESVSRATSIETHSIVGQPSPLEQYFRLHGSNQDTVSQLSQRLLDAAASVKQETRAIHDLHQRFASDTDLDGRARATLNELLHNHIVKLQSALNFEDDMIGNGLVARKSNHVPPATDASPEVLSAYGDRNLALCRELISFSNAAPRSAEAIAADLQTSTQELRAIVSGVSINGAPSSQTTNSSSQNR